MYGDNLPDGFSHADAIAAGIVERVPGFEDYFDTLIGEMGEEYENLSDSEKDDLYEREMEQFERERDEAIAERLIEEAEYEATQWDGYEP
jgi:hypothetical protein